MKNNEIVNQYMKMLDSVKLGGYDGRGKGVDVYECEGGHKFFTRYKDKGTTPFMIKCRECEKPTMATHNNTISESEAELMGVKVHNWVRPSLDVLFEMNEATIEHVLQGGLILEEEVEAILKKSKAKKQYDPYLRLQQKLARRYANKHYKK